MRHVVCLTMVVMRAEGVDGPDDRLQERIPHCPVCQRDVDVSELTDGVTRSEWEWNGDDK